MAVLAYSDLIEISNTRVYYGDAPPTNGTFLVGDLLIVVPTSVATPSPSSPLAYRCTTASVSNNGGSWSTAGAGALVLNSPTLTSASSSFTLFVSPGAYTVAGISVTFGTASASGTMQAEIATGTQAIGSGTNFLTGTMSLAGTANTPVNGTLNASTAVAAGNRINIILAGTLTGLANCVVTVILN